MAEGSEADADALRRLEQRLDRAAEAAERLLGDAVAAGLGAASPSPSPSPSQEQSAEVPPAGWQRPGDEAGPVSGGGEMDVLLAILASVRDRIPPELQRRLADAIREVLLAVRALIDWYLERTERRRAEPTQVQDIPIL
jgi:class 3 adenylate cyclase